MNFINKNFKWISLGGNILVFISLFLPFASVSADVFGMAINKSIAFIDGDGVLVLFAILAASGLLFIKKNQFSLIPLGISLVIVIYDVINLGSSMGEITGAYSDMIKVSLGVGFYLILLGLIASIGSLVYGKFIMKKLNQSVNTVPQMNNQQVNYEQPVNQMPVDVNQMNMQPMDNGVVNIINEQPVNQMYAEPMNQSSQKFCSNCGAKQNPNSKFCEFCGNKLN